MSRSKYSRRSGAAWWGLRTKTALGVGILVFFSLFVSGIVAYLESRSIAIRDLLSSISSDASLDESEIARIAQDSAADLMVIRQTPSVQGVLRAMAGDGVDPVGGEKLGFWIGHAQMLFGVYLRNRPHYLRLRLLDDKGRELLRMDRVGDEVVAAPAGALRDLRDSSYYSAGAGLKYGQVYYSSISLLRDGASIVVPHVAVFRLVTPIFDAKGRLAGMVVLNVTASRIFDALRTWPGGGEKYLLDQDGFFLVHPNPSKEFGFEFDNSLRLDRLLPDIAGKVDVGESGTLFDKRAKSLISYRRIHYDPLDAGRYWLLVYRIPEKVALADVNETSRLMIVTGLLVAAFGLVAILWFISRRIVSPIVNLAWAVGAMERGDSSIRADEAAVRDEFKVLYRAFNSLAKAQEEAVDRLVQEISERESVQVSLSRSEELFRTTLEKMLEGCQIVDREYRYIFVNAAAAAQGRRSKEELLGRTMMEVYPGIEETRMFAAIETCMTEGRASHFQNHFQNPDGSAGWFELSIQPAPEGVFILSADISEAKRLEAERLAREAAEMANRTKSDFLANMSHELRTPLNSIIGFTEVLQDSLYGELNGKQREYLRYIETSGRHLLELINDILDLSKVEAGKEEVELSSCSVRDLLDLSITMLREKANSHSISLDREIAPEADIRIFSDEHKLRQILFNLLSNAVKFTPDGGMVRVEARLSETTPRRLALSVSDTGIGIEEADLGRLFHEFSQLDSPLQKRYEGTGLGLALTKRLVEMLGGSIEVTSRFGEGSVFTVFLPLEVALPGRASRPE